jgi:tetratricopeptide (TPR) repeat protein
LLAGVALAALAVTASPAAARVSMSDPARTYVEARAAAMSGDHAEAAQLLASLANAQPGQVDLARTALAEAIGAGEMDLAVGLARSIPPAKLTTEARMLLVADEIKHGHPERAVPWLNVSGASGDLSQLIPLVNAWAAADRGDEKSALAALDQIPQRTLLGPLMDEERALILLKFRHSADAEPYVRRAVGNAGSRERMLRLAFADGFLAAGDRARALMIIEGMGQGEFAARQRITAGKMSGQAIDSLPKALSDALTGFSIDLARMQRSAPPIGLVQVARYLNPQNGSAITLLALLLAQQDRSDEALALLRAVPQNDALIADVRDVQTRILTNAKRYNEAYQLAATAAAAPQADATDFSRLGDVLEAMKRHDAAADAYGRAVELTQAHGVKSDLWTLLLLRASALQEGKHWTEAKAALQQALALQPEQPLLLNFLGYTELERGENLDAAEAMIAKASELAPDDASITDSLGWAQYKRGKVQEAIATLQKAAESDPGQAEIQEHLGDALYKSGRRLEARFAWNAALVTAEDEIAARVKAKLASGLTPVNAAP